MLIIRLIRTGKKNAPSFRIVLIEKTASPKSGKFLEILGNYNPRLKEVNFKKERIKYWLSQGVQISETVHNLLVKGEIIKGPKIKKKIRIKKSRREVGIPTQKASGKKVDKSKEKSKIEKE
jgi:small subunit ribosomal protein S16